MVNNNKYTDRDWEELASMLSGEQEENKKLLKEFISGDSHKISMYWKNLRSMDDKKEINVDKAWSRVSSKLKMTDENPAIYPAKNLSARFSFLKIAAAILLLFSIGAAAIFTYNKGVLTGRTTVATDSREMNLQVRLPDGSNVYLNRNTHLSYNFRRGGQNERNVKLSGEAFFEIAPDASKPFVVDAGRANVKVLGTSFNVITSNNDSAVEVFVKTGKVMLADSSGSRSLILDPGFIGTMNSKATGKKLNDELNYLAWNTGKLTYEGQKLEIVFRDLQKLYDIEINATDTSILSLPIATSFNNEPHETIIRIICTTFNLSYSKDGNIYHLGKK